jgi:uncharacterized membrane protein (DUF106 family)
MAKNKEGSFRMVMIFMVLTMLIAFNWDKWIWMKNGIHSVLDPTVGALLNWELTLGMLITVLIISFLTTLVQKYTTDQDELRKIKKEQKEIQKQMKEFKKHPEKMMHLQKKQMSLMPKQMKLSMRTIVYTGIPFVLLFRWFSDYFLILSEVTGEPARFFGVLGWFMFYLIGTLVFSSILKKYMKVV